MPAGGSDITTCVGSTQRLGMVKVRNSLACAGALTTKLRTAEAVNAVGNKSTLRASAEIRCMDSFRIVASQLRAVRRRPSRWRRANYCLRQTFSPRLGVH